MVTDLTSDGDILNVKSCFHESCPMILGWQGLIVAKIDNDKPCLSASNLGAQINESNKKR